MRISQVSNHNSTNALITKQDHSFKQQKGGQCGRTRGQMAQDETAEKGGGRAHMRRGVTERFKCGSDLVCFMFFKR